ncbi:MAG: hypothetical protein H6741_21565 [Alphaproteobacteria bacterium]|nr:hypothetical protein [Alphaproteobacteria bacterium]
MDTAKKHAIPRSLAALALPLGTLLLGLRGPLESAARGLWGPEDPWRNGDFVLGWWWWWASAQRGGEALSRVQWPEGMASIAPVVPNPLDMALLGALGPPSPLAWNLAQLGHLLALLASAMLLCRAAGARAWSAGVALSLVAASPVLLHEVAGGRPSNLLIWPALLSLACLWRGGARWGALAGLLAALQAVAYAYHGLALLFLGLPLVRDRRALLAGLVTGLLAVSPYVLWLTGNLEGLPTDRPAAGYTALPLAGLLGWGVPERFSLHPALLPAALLGLALARRAAWRWALAALLAGLISLGPELTWDLGEPLAAGPWAWVAWAFPPATRMHHPVRATLLLLPLLALLLALGLDRLPRGPRLGLGVLLMVAALLNAPAMDRASSYDRPAAPPYAADAEALPLPEGPVVDLLGMPHQVALSLQPYHRRALLEPLWSRRPEGPLQAGAERLSRGEDPGAAFFRDLDEAGFVGVLVWPRFGEGEAARELVERYLGEAVAPGVYALGP